MRQVSVGQGRVLGGGLVLSPPPPGCWLLLPH